MHDNEANWESSGLVRKTPARRSKLLEKVRKGLGVHVARAQRATEMNALDLISICIIQTFERLQAFENGVWGEGEMMSIMAGRYILRKVMVQEKLLLVMSHS